VGIIDRKGRRKKKENSSPFVTATTIPVVFIYMNTLCQRSVFKKSNIYPNIFLRSLRVDFVMYPVERLFVCHV